MICVCPSRLDLVPDFYSLKNIPLVYHSSRAHGRTGVQDCFFPSLLLIVKNRDGGQIRFAHFFNTYPSYVIAALLSDSDTFSISKSPRPEPTGSIGVDSALATFWSTFFNSFTLSRLVYGSRFFCPPHTMGRN